MSHRELASTRAKAALDDIIEALKFIEAVMTGGDSYTSCKRTGKPESKVPGDVSAASMERSIEERLERVSHDLDAAAKTLKRISREASFSTAALERALDGRRDRHDNGDHDPRTEARVVKHLVNKYAKEEPNA